MNVILRVAGFGILILLIVLVPVYKIFGLSYIFWIALAACSLTIWWAYAAYRKIYSKIVCPKCGFSMTYQQLRKSGECPRCGKDLSNLFD